MMASKVIVDTNAWMAYSANNPDMGDKIVKAIVTDLLEKNRIEFLDIIGFEIWEQNVKRALMIHPSIELCQLKAETNIIKITHFCFNNDVRLGFADAIILEAAFRYEKQIVTKNTRLSDAAKLLNLSYGPDFK